MTRTIDTMPRAARRGILKREKAERARGLWPAWEKVTFPPGTAGGKGWTREITMAWRNGLFSVLVRDAGGGVTHLAVASMSGNRPTFHEMQRIKNDLAGPEKTAVEVYPPAAELVDQAPMFHLWVLPEPLPFSIYEGPRHD